MKATTVTRPTRVLPSQSTPRCPGDPGKKKERQAQLGIKPSTVEASHIRPGRVTPCTAADDDPAAVRYRYQMQDDTTTPRSTAREDTWRCDGQSASPCNRRVGQSAWRGFSRALCLIIERSRLFLSARGAQMPQRFYDHMPRAAAIRGP